MNVAIMQPYFFPYAGYFQLLMAADVFVLLDDIQYIQRGWINRNRILLNGEPFGIVRSVVAASHRLAINERFYTDDARGDAKLLRLIDNAYRRAPHFERVFALVSEILASQQRNVAAFNAELVRRVAAELELPASIRCSSELSIDRALRGVDRVIAICRMLGADRYINPSGGTTLYRDENFEANGLELRFLRPLLPEYPQFGAPHVGSLSIIDVMMFNSGAALSGLLNSYELLNGADMRRIL